MCHNAIRSWIHPHLFPYYNFDSPSSHVQRAAYHKTLTKFKPKTKSSMLIIIHKYNPKIHSYQGYRQDIKNEENFSLLKISFFILALILIDMCSICLQLLARHKNINTRIVMLIWYSICMLCEFFAEDGVVDRMLGSSQKTSTF